MEISLIGKHALVCGASQGIGEAIALKLADIGASVILLARNNDKLSLIKKKLVVKHENQKHHILAIDLTDLKKLKQKISEHLLTIDNPISILINNTGGPKPGLTHLSDISEYTSAFNQHLLANQILLQTILPDMKKLNFGRIINIISTSVKQPIQGLGVSNTIRAAVANWAKSLAFELGKFGVTVNNVLPGATNTSRLKSILENKATKQNLTLDQITNKEIKKIPLNRFADPSEIANAVAFLASEQAGYITGINLPVDGGRTGCL